jgi:hypothetical protein
VVLGTVGVGPLQVVQVLTAAFGQDLLGALVGELFPGHDPREQRYFVVSGESAVHAVVDAVLAALFPVGDASALDFKVDRIASAHRARVETVGDEERVESAPGGVRLSVENTFLGDVPVGLYQTGRVSTNGAALAWELDQFIRSGTNHFRTLHSEALVDSVLAEAHGAGIRARSPLGLLLVEFTLVQAIPAGSHAGVVYTANVIVGRRGLTSRWYYHVTERRSQQRNLGVLLIDLEESDAVLQTIDLLTVESVHRTSFDLVSLEFVQVARDIIRTRCQHGEEFQREFQFPVVRPQPPQRDVVVDATVVVDVQPRQSHRRSRKGVVLPFEKKRSGGISGFGYRFGYEPPPNQTGVVGGGHVDRQVSRVERLQHFGTQLGQSTVGPTVREIKRRRQVLQFGSSSGSHVHESDDRGVVGRASQVVDLDVVNQRTFVVQVQPSQAGSTVRVVVRRTRSQSGLEEFTRHFGHDAAAQT